MIKTGELALSKAEFKSLISVVDRLEDEVLFRLAVETGMRRKDIANVKINDIDLKENWIFFYEHKKDRNWSVPISNEMVRKIKQLIDSKGKQKSKYLFDFSDRTAYNRLQKYKDKAGIRPNQAIKFHALRSTCIKFCQKAGWSEQAVSRLTGDTISVIHEHYQTPSYAEMQELANNNKIIE